MKVWNILEFIKQQIVSCGHLLIVGMILKNVRIYDQTLKIDI